ncbi:TonB-dependent receptor [Bacteroidia bacterium]|nr:TonB-dependent receptor [Bacteroidia bacterium]
MRKLALIISVASSFILFGQGNVSGIIVEKTTQTPIEYANVAIYQQDGKYISGTMTDSLGSFFIDNIAEGEYELQYSFIGFETTETVTFGITKTRLSVNLGALSLMESAQNLDAVIVTGRKSTYVTKIDKKIFNVGEDLMSVSGSASDLLENVPSIQVDMDGNVSLRGSENVQILINGKVSSLMGTSRATVLQQIPAQNIERVEVITNPSAKYKPDGASGIINIVLKKERRQGVNGVFAANAGNQDRYNSTLSLNYNPGKINLSVSYGIRYDNRNRFTYNNRIKKDSLSLENSYIDESTIAKPARPLSQLVRGGIDWDISKKDNLQAEVSYSYITMLRHETTDILYRNNLQDTTNHYSRFRLNNETENDLELGVAYEHSFGKDHTITIDYTHSSNSELEDNKYTNTYFFPRPIKPAEKDNTLIWQAETRHVIRADYNRPLGEDAALNLGTEIELTEADLNFSAERLSGLQWISDVEKTNHFILDEQIYAVYATYEAEFGDFGVMGGLRSESVRTQSQLISTDSVIPNNYVNIFPTLHTSYHFSDKHEMQLNYSLRINRPEGDDLNPFPEYKDPYNLSSGNPRLKPEKIHSLELGYLLKHNATTFLTTVYYRHTFNRITEITRYINDSVLWTTKENMASSQSTGLEFILSTAVSQWLTVNLNSNIYYNVIDASDLGFSSQKSVVAWNLSLNGNINITKNLMAQINTRYTAKSLTPQGYREPSYILNAGARYNLLNNKAAILFTVSDLLNTFSSVTQMDTPELKARMERKRVSQIFYIGFTYNFGKSQKKDKEVKLKYEEQL